MADEHSHLASRQKNKSLEDDWLPNITRVATIASVLAKVGNNDNKKNNNYKNNDCHNNSSDEMNDDEQGYMIIINQRQFQLMHQQ